MSNLNLRRILLIDDDELSSVALSKRLQRRGLDVELLTNPNLALHSLRTNPPDLLLLDIVMPELDGLTLLKQIRLLYSKQQLPVIMITALDDSLDIVEAFSLGANDYVTKPVNIDAALARIEAHLSTVELCKDEIRRKELAAVTAMITTYNHEINNPLAIALNCIDDKNFGRDIRKIELLKKSLLRVADIIKKIQHTTEQHDIQFSPYAGDSKMVKLK